MILELPQYHWCRPETFVAMDTLPCLVPHNLAYIRAGQGRAEADALTTHVICGYSLCPFTITVVISGSVFDGSEPYTE